MVACNDLTVGGTLSSAGLSGGTSLNSYAITVEDWSQFLGTGGISGSVQVVNNRPGGYLAGDLMPRPRFPILTLAVTDRNATGGLTASTPAEQKMDNTDDLLALIANPGGNYYEIDMPDTTSRFIYAYVLDPTFIEQPQRKRTIRIPLTSPFAYWKEGGNESSDTIASADTMVVGGNANVYDAVLTFSGAGTFTHSTLGWTITTTAACVVDLGNRTVTVGGVPAENLMRHSDDYWGYFTPGNNSVTSDVSVGVVWRASWM